jgi:hypothetical protein
MLNAIKPKLKAAVAWLLETTAESARAVAPKLEEMATSIAPAEKPANAPVVLPPPVAEPRETSGKVIEFSQKPVCTVEACDRPSHAKGLCSRHYSRARRQQKRAA